MKKRHILCGLGFVVWAWTLLTPAAQAILTWNAVTLDLNGNPLSGVTYNVYRGSKADGSDGAVLNSLPVAMTTYTDTTLNATAIYYYAVTAVAGAKESTKSNLVRFSFSDGTPQPPGGLTIRGALTVKNITSEGAQISARIQVTGLKSDTSYTARLDLIDPEGHPLELRHQNFRTW